MDYQKMVSELANFAQTHSLKLETRAELEQAAKGALGISIATLYNRANEIKAQHGVNILDLAREAINGAPIPVKAPNAEESAPAPKAADDTAAILEAVKVLTRAGGVSADEVRAIIRSELEKSAPSKVIHVIKTENGEKELPPGTVLPDYWDILIKKAQLRQNILLVGKPGTGKTHSAALLAKALDLPFFSLSVTAGMSESQLAGWYVPNADGNGWAYRASDFVTAYENGGVFLLDEIDAADANTACFLNSALANGHFHIPNRPGKPAYKSDKFILVAGANTMMTGGGRAFAGREVQDQALVDRFLGNIIKTDYSAAVEKALISAHVLAWGYKVRAALESCGMGDTHFCSTRFLKNLSDMGIAYPEYDKQSYWEEQLFMTYSKDEQNKVRANMA